ncbi:hypothetical protein Tco_0727474 [Tanacetum coccineum]|uniref:Uncharacterized protein n=1 Tax=Tanacetum coccineum TaxID=301880 RepID=A0ABQ4YIH4_9ASTR
MANLPPNDDANAFVPNFNIEFEPNPGHAHFANNSNNNGWIEWDVPLGEWNGYSKRKPKTAKPSTGRKRQSQFEAKPSQVKV